MTAPSTAVSEWPVRRLAATELAACQSLAYGREWHYPDHTWRLLFDIGELHGIFDDGELVSVAALTRFGPDVAAIGMVLTDPRLGGRGLAGRVMRRVLERAGDAVVSLYATAAGRPLYEKLGFTAESDNTMYFGSPKFDAAPKPRTRPAIPADLPEILKLDGEAMGVDRSDLVVRLFDYCDHLRVTEHSGRIVGYGGAWRTSDQYVLGPLLAADTDTARCLLDDIASRCRGPVRLEASSRRPWLAEWASDRDLTERATITWMVHQGRKLPGNRDRWHIPFSVAVN